MAIPIKIDPDNLKQSIVNIKFDVNIPFELVLGKFFGALQTLEFTYIPGPRSAAPLPTNNPNQRIEFANSGPGVFHNSKIKLQILDTGNLIFTMFSSYIGWADYFKNIQEVLKELTKLNIITSYKNIGLRYISEYVNEPIEPYIRSHFSWNINGKNMDRTASVYKTEFNEKKRRVVINIASQLERFNQSIQSVERFSIIDIDIICPLNNVGDLGVLIDEIDTSHTMEKEYFFGLLTHEYVSSINPTY